MNSMDTIDLAINRLKIHYYGSAGVLVVLFLLALLRIFPFSATEVPVSVTVDRYAIMITIIAIPLSLKYFADQLKKAEPPLTLSHSIQKYRRLSFLRLYILNAVTLMHIVLLGFSHNTNYLWFTLVLLIIFLFCKPSGLELENLTKKEELVEDPQDGTNNND